MTTIVTLYSVQLCEPCRALKTALTEANIPYLEINLRDVEEIPRKAILKSILGVSRAKHATVPAVHIWIEEEEHWISNHGETDITSMLAEIKGVLGIT